MENLGIWSLIPPVVAIVLALRTKQVFLSLSIGIWVGWIILKDGNVFLGTLETLNAFVKVFEDAGNTRTVIFTLLVGALIALIQRSGGVLGFIYKVQKYLEKKQNASTNRKQIQFFTAITGLLIFVESNISILTVGTLFRPIFDKYKIPREKLAYLADSSSAPSCIIFPFNAWGAFIMSILISQGIEDPFSTLFSSIVFNFYPFLALAFLFYIIFSGKDFGPMANAEKRALEEGKVIADGATPMISDEISMLAAKENIPLRAFNMIIPIVIMVMIMPITLLYTGWSSDLSGGLIDKCFTAIGNGSGSTAVMYSVFTAIFIAVITYRSQGLLKTREMIDISLKGMSGMVSLALLMVFAFALSSLCKELGTGFFIAEVAKAWLSPSLVPAIIFISSCFIAFSTGTSWGTFAIMLSIAIPMSQGMDTNLNMAIAAAIGGGVFGDHCSPISDTTIISSMASASDHIDHVKTQLPYALIAGGATFLLYLIFGFVF